MKNNNSSGTNGMHDPSCVTAIPLTREHYMVIGNPRGEISDPNPNVLSIQQMHTIKSILIYGSNKNNINCSNNNNNNRDFIVCIFCFDKPFGFVSEISPLGLPITM